MCFILLMLTACDPTKPPIEIIPNMDRQDMIKPQAEPPRLPVEGTISRGHMPYPYPNDPEAAGRNLKNPLPPSSDIVHRGQFLFNAYCLPCHGADGKGQGPVAQRGFVPPPSLHTDRVQKWPDGRIFHIMTEGQGIMSSYAGQVDPIDRWAIIHYIRTLQKVEKQGSES
ncbi:MAG: hypothetical protein A3B70_06805 [Deltaproteobacteria bacterium RIFCSPHIGHO2_02_FULL_40_11]|nr:MAG: hypothetical protein A3B70_06805 [Deltaproteobacteria bacterium RIFCSPHIGHO2_02_FULL_40_11]